MEVIGYDPFISVDAAWGLSRHIKKAADISSIYEKSDYITLHLPFNANTEQMINESAISQMKDNVRILNFARAELVDTEALKAGIDKGKIAKYVCDFPNNKLSKYNNVLCLPHLGASTPESEDNCAVMAVKEIKDYIENGNIRNSVNFPTVRVPRTTKARIAIIHENIPKMLSQISNEVSKDKLNIENLVNGSKGSMAYTIIDVESDVDDLIVKQISDINGVIRVRVIK